MDLTEKLRKFFSLRDECPFELNKFKLNESNPSQKFCPSTADYLICFPSTPANQTIYFNCPYKPGLAVKDPDSHVSRYCNPNGTWASTDYNLCKKNIITTVHSVKCRLVNKTNHSVNGKAQHIECEEISNESIYEFMLLANLIGFSITIISVSIAIFIFLSIR